MNSKIDYLLNYIRRAIPPQILEYAFNAPTQFNTIRPSIDYALRSTIIDGWVLKDCNMEAGIECFVDLTFSQMVDYPGGTIVKIPPSQTGGKNITSVFSVSFNMGSYYLPNMGNAIVNAVDGPSQLSAARIQLVGPNTIYFEGGLISSMRFLKCTLENDAEFANFHDRSMKVIAHLCLLATKAYIYNEFIIKVETMPYIQGIPTGKLGDIINEWADSFEMYTEYRNEKLKKVAFLNDRTSHSRHIRMLMPR